MYLQLEQHHNDFAKSERVHRENKQSFATVDSGFQGFDEFSMR